jgi:hypothetical protein
MASDQQLINALCAAAEQLINRKLTTEELDRLVKLFNESKGQNRTRTREALTNFSRLNENQLLEKCAASDNTNRVFKDLDNVITNWKPGS